MSDDRGFSGSYAAEDVTFLLDPLESDDTAGLAVAPVSVVEKEQLLQMGNFHYSELISRETPPTETLWEHYHAAMRRHGRRLAAEIATLAGQLSSARPNDPIVLISLARAGTPIGILLRRALRDLEREAVHYSVSIVRDRGLDYCALNDIRRQYAESQWLFVDGWTGKGTIQRELTSTLREYNRNQGADVAAELAVVIDLSGQATWRATADDYPLPCGMLNAVVSGLVSRTIIPPVTRDAPQRRYHRCLFYREFLEFDVSRSFVDAIDQERREWVGREPAKEDAKSEDGDCFQVRREFINALLTSSLVDDWLKIKPGIGEAGRALARRVPERLLVRDPEHDDVRHLLAMAAEKDVQVERRSEMPYEAIAIIRSLGGRR